MKKLFFVIFGFLAYLSLSTFPISVAHAQSILEKKCEAGCDNAHTPGVGLGKSLCWVTLIAPTDATNLQVQLLDQKGVGILKNSEGKIAIRGGVGTTRVSLDCGQLRHSSILIICAKFGGKDRHKIFEAENLRTLISNLKDKGGQEIGL